MSMYDLDSMLLFGGFLSIIILVAMGIALIAHILMALGLYRMAFNKGIENPWLAWIPVGNLWILGNLIETIDFGDRKFDNAGLILAVGTFGSFIPMIGPLVGIVYAIVLLMAHYKLYKMYAPGNQVLFLILSIFFPGIVASILIFVIRNNTPVAVTEA